MTYTAAIGTADSSVVQYRADVDGLRAIAVLSVIAYHLFASAVPGGYLGVDIFFVISGYLITLVIWREMQVGRFSIGKFYSRRSPQNFAGAAGTTILFYSCCGCLFVAGDARLFLQELDCNARIRRKRLLLAGRTELFLASSRVNAIAAHVDPRR